MSEDNYNDRPVWRTVLSVILAIIAVIRFGVSCSKMNERKYNAPALYDQEMQTNNSYVEPLIQQPIKPHKGYNDVLYKDYKYLDSLNNWAKSSYHLSKVQEDTLVGLDLNTEVKIAKGSYFQNSHDDTLKFAFKTKQNLAVFIHDFESKQSADKAFKELKIGSRINNYRTYFKLSENSKLACYDITKGKLKFKGVVYSFSQKEYKMYIEFESSILPQSALVQKSLKFISTNLKSIK